MKSPFFVAEFLLPPSLPGEVSPVLRLHGFPPDAVREGDQGGVVDPDLMTFEDLRRAALLTAGPGTVTLPVPQLVGGNLQTTIGIEEY